MTAAKRFARPDFVRRTATVLRAKRLVKKDPTVENYDRRAQDLEAMWRLAETACELNAKRADAEKARRLEDADILETFTRSLAGIGTLTRALNGTSHIQPAVDWLLAFTKAMRKDVAMGDERTGEHDEGQVVEVDVVVGDEPEAGVEVEVVVAEGAAQKAVGR